MGHRPRVLKSLRCEALGLHGARLFHQDVSGVLAAVCRGVGAVPLCSSHFIADIVILPSVCVLGAIVIFSQGRNLLMLFLFSVLHGMAPGPHRTEHRRRRNAHLRHLMMTSHREQQQQQQQQAKAKTVKKEGTLS